MFVAKRWRRSKRATKNGKPETLGNLGTRYIANTKRKEQKQKKRATRNPGDEPRCRQTVAVLCFL